jgi:hypothetical protein
VPRLLAIAVLTLFASGPALNLPCLLWCAPLQGAASSAESCHHPTAGEKKLSGVGNCDAGLTHPPALTPKGRDTSFSVGAVVAVRSLSQLPHDASLALERVYVPATGPPPPLLLLPLRI